MNKTTIATVTYKVWHGGPMDGRMVERQIEERFPGHKTANGCQQIISRAHNYARKYGPACQPKTHPVVVSVRYE